MNIGDVIDVDMPQVPRRCRGAFTLGLEVGRALMAAQMIESRFEIYVHADNADDVVRVLCERGRTASHRMVHDDWSIVATEANGTT